MLDINLFREEKGGNPEKIRESQRRRFANVDLVDEVIELDKIWRQRQFELDGLRTDRNRLSKEIARLKIVSAIIAFDVQLAKEDASTMIASTEENKELTAKKEAEVQEALAAVQTKLAVIGNLVHDSVPVDNNEDNNAIIRSWGEKRSEPKLKNHVELVELLGIADLKKGANVAGGRGFYLKGDGVRLNQALINLALDFLEKRSFTALQTPFFMRKDIMAKCAQLAQFDEELYKVSGDGDDKYLIATAEQPLCAYHLDDWIHPSQLPLRYAGYSSCFRKEAGSHVVSIVSGALNDAAAKKYDLEGWFPASKTYRELVSCSNCTDYQSRRLEVRYGQKKSNDKAKEYVHMLNSTLTATERTICCILENNQKEDGVEIPEALRAFMGGKAFIPFKTINPGKETKGKKN
ncbi:serine--tRNA ligase [Striga asiatica]|uniref:serine--tRNA ligase n=1 Tax=Striga asiatica TaxID=4170 RepID=A0A5A7QTN4_STRAF|nr:serine--tRNA ligase [Striga asiatica]